MYRTDCPAFFKEGRRKTVTVPLRTLDSVVKEEGITIGPRSLIFVDIQGHEGRLFRGGRETFQCGAPVVSEFWPYGIRRSGMDWHEYYDTVKDLFAGYYGSGDDGHRFYPISELRRLYERHDDPRSFTDVLFLREEIKA